MDLNLQPLLNGLTEMSKASLLQSLLAMSKSEGGLWSLTLKSLMTAGTGDEYMSHVLVDLMMSDELDHNEQKLQTLQCLIGAETSIYNLKIMVENYSKMLGNIDGSHVKGKILEAVVRSFRRIQNSVEFYVQLEIFKSSCLMNT